MKPVDGYIHLPQEPGLGLEMDEDALAKYAYKQFPLRKLPFPEDDGRVGGVRVARDDRLERLHDLAGHRQRIDAEMRHRGVPSSRAVPRSRMPASRFPKSTTSFWSAA